MSTPERVASIPIADIIIDPEIQARVATDDSVVAEYAEAMRDGARFDAVVVFDDGGSRVWLADGFHRVAAAQLAGLTEIEVVLHEGERRDALLFAAGANARHGLRRTNADKRRAVERLLTDPEWSQWNNCDIARECAVSDRFVAKVRGDLSPNGSRIDPPTRLVERGGTIYEMRVPQRAAEGAGADPFVGVEQAEDDDPFAGVEAGPPASMPTPTPAPAPVPARTKPTRPQDEPPPGVEPDAGQPRIDPQAEWERAEKEVERLEAEIEALTSTDKDREILKMSATIAGLNATVQRLMGEKNEKGRQVEYYLRLLAKIRKALGVERNEDVLRQIADLESRLSATPADDLAIRRGMRELCDLTGASSVAEVVERVRATVMGAEVA